MPPLLTIAEVAQALRCSKRTVEHLVSARSIRVVRIGRMVRFRPEDVAQFVERKTR